MCIQSYQEIRFLKFTLLAASAVSQFDIDKEQVDVTKITDTMCKLKKKGNIFYKVRKYVWKFSETYPPYCSLLRVQLGLHFSICYGVGYG